MLGSHPVLFSHKHAVMCSCFLLNMGGFRMVPFEPPARGKVPLCQEQIAQVSDVTIQPREVEAAMAVSGG